MTYNAKVSDAHQLISSMLILDSREVLETPHGMVARWVVNETLFYLEAMLNYGSWQNAGFNEPCSEVKTFARRYGVVL